MGERVVLLGVQQRGNGQLRRMRFYTRLFIVTRGKTGKRLFCTISLDTAKVRLQLQRKATPEDGASVPKYWGLLGTIVTIAKEEGLSALWKVVTAGLHRQFIYVDCGLDCTNQIGEMTFAWN